MTSNGFMYLKVFAFILVLLILLFKIIFIIPKKNIFENRFELKYNF